MLDTTQTIDPPTGANLGRLAGVGRTLSEAAIVTLWLEAAKGNEAIVAHKRAEMIQALNTAADLCGYELTPKTSAPTGMRQIGTLPAYAEAAE